MSLTTRLTLLFALVSVAVFASLGFLIKHSMEEHFVAQDFAELDDKIRTTANLLNSLKTGESPPSIHEVMKNTVVDHDSIIIKIDTSSGGQLFASGPIAFPFDKTQLLNKPGQIQRAAWNEGDIRYRGAAMALEGRDSSRHLILSAAIETTRHRVFMQQFAKELSGLMLTATLFSALLGWLVARQGLAPLRLMRAKAKSVTATRLDQRLPVDTIPVELASLAQELNRMFDRLEESFTRLTHFSSDIAHELRTPISNLMTQTQVSLSRARSAEEYQDILASNVEELEKLSRMISDMLFLAKAEHGLQLPSRQRFPLEVEVAKLLEFYEALADEKQVHMQLQGSGELSGDRLMIDRAISNLLSNALRHTPEGGLVDLYIERGIDALTLTICNDGNTIPAQDLPYLFDRFYRCDQARGHNESEGTGLGLSITRAIVHAHGGKVTVKSANNRTCFTLSFPH
ncbi:heavy metal sensor histidine kinase [Marinobacterium sp. AK62]|uniref:Sensor protein n=1 Tax=Marinobacterium alkalitolerans TaxID=1542925 RepID=A0ABS3ZB36_9GAMM|nr:heavy metal sensor histidine kinase [Marinobacterium alkalitolerans]MBP0048570.1 heavy metal sensor histidine kinase [Marinobacterium alkalitolerans]